MITSRVSVRNVRETTMPQIDIKKPNGPVVPVAVAVVVAILGIAGFLFVVRSPPSTGDNAGESMISAAVIDGAGATEVPSASQH